jgi:hypothetical protein
MNKIVLACALSLGIGAGVGMGVTWELQSAAPPSDSDTNSAAPARLGFLQPQNMVSASTGIDRAELRTMLREELATVLAARGANPVTVTTAAEVAKPPSQEIVTQRREAVGAIDGMIAGGVWGEEQRTGFRDKLAVLDPEQRDHAMQELITGLNAGTIRMGVVGSPF